MTSCTRETHITKAESSCILMIIPEADAEGQVGQIYADILEIFGNVPIVYKALALKPEILERFWRLAETVFKSKTIPWNTKLLIALDVANSDGCVTCTGGYRAMLKDVGLSDAILNSVEERVVSPELDDSTQSVMVYAYAISKDPHDIDRNLIASFRRRLSDEKLVEIVSTINIFKSIIETIHSLALHEME